VEWWKAVDAFAQLSKQDAKVLVKSAIGLGTQGDEDLSVMVDMLAVLGLLFSDGFVRSMKNSRCSLVEVFLGNVALDGDINAVVLADVVWGWSPYVVALFGCAVALAGSSADRRDWTFNLDGDASALVAFLNDCLDGLMALEERLVLLTVEEMVAMAEFVLLSKWVGAGATDFLNSGETQNRL
jgi:hypothetical protein